MHNHHHLCNFIYIYPLCKAQEDLRAGNLFCEFQVSLSRRIDRKKRINLEKHDHGGAGENETEVEIGKTQVM